MSVKEIKIQQDECKKIIQDKEELIKEFHDHLKKKDTDYIKAMAQMNDDIDNLIRDMQNQLTHMRQDYQRELGNIEKAFDDERDQITEYNNAEIEALFKEHTDQETQAALKRAAQEEENAKQLEDVRNLDANNQADQKIKLEREMQILEKCMEDMKAVYKLNEEKLGFNFRVLTEKIRVNENTKKSNLDKKRNYLGIKRNVVARYNKQQLE